MPVARVVKEVDVDIDVEMEDIDTEDLIEELEERGFLVHEKAEYDGSIEYLYSTWRTCSDDMFQKELKNFFGKHLNIDVR